MSLDTRINLFGLACGAVGWLFGYVHCWSNHQQRLKDASERAEDAYRRYWNNYDRDEF